MYNKYRLNTEGVLVLLNQKQDGYPNSNNMQSMFFLFAASFGCYILIHIESTLLKRQAILPGAIIHISYRLEMKGILMCFSVHFLIIPRAPTFIDTVVVFRRYIFSITISRSVYYLTILLHIGTLLLSFYSFERKLMVSHWSLNDRVSSNLHDSS